MKTNGANIMKWAVLGWLALVLGAGSVWAAPAPEMQPVNLGTPRIDLQAVEEALHRTRTSSPQDFRGWMQQFEDEANAIYFATLRRQFPQADPATLMPKPVRVDAQWHNQMLFLYGYIDQNNIQGFQHGQDLMLFAFEQTRPYDRNNRRAYYALRDGDGYYYRDADYAFTWAPNAYPYFVGFFVYPSLWSGLYWRPSFLWWGGAYWQTGFFYSRYNYYYGRYPRYYNVYRTTYFNRYRPWGWRRGVFFRANGGRYYYRSRTWATQHRQWRRQYRSYLGQRRTMRQNQRRWQQSRRRWHRQHRTQQNYRRYHRQRNWRQNNRRPQYRRQNNQRRQMQRNNRNQGRRGAQNNRGARNNRGGNRGGGRRR